MLKISFSTFFLSMVWLLYTQNFMFTRPALHVFFVQITSQIFDKIDQTKYLQKKSMDSFVSFKKRMSIFSIKTEHKIMFYFSELFILLFSLPDP